MPNNTFRLQPLPSRSHLDDALTPHHGRAQVPKPDNRKHGITLTLNTSPTISTRLGTAAYQIDDMRHREHDGVCPDRD
jgi:hypothetical protein